jgi:hypothetical protein
MMKGMWARCSRFGLCRKDEKRCLALKLFRLRLAVGYRLALETGGSG